MTASASPAGEDTLRPQHNRDLSNTQPAQPLSNKGRDNPETQENLPLIDTEGSQNQNNADKPHTQELCMLYATHRRTTSSSQHYHIWNIY